MNLDDSIGCDTVVHCGMLIPMNTEQLKEVETRLRALRDELLLENEQAVESTAPVELD